MSVGGSLKVDTLKASSEQMLVTRVPFYRVMRWLEQRYCDAPRIGKSLHPSEERHRLEHHASQAFRANECEYLYTEFERGGDSGEEHKRVLGVNFFGLLGAQGPLPAHMTEAVLRTEAVEGGTHDALVAFINMFQHRLLSAYYRSWAQTQPVVQRERGEDDRFSLLLRHLAGGTAGEDNAPFKIGPEAIASKGLSHLRELIEANCSCRVSIEEFVGAWYTMPEAQRSCLSMGRAGLGQSAWLGQSIYSRSHKIRIRVGKLTLIDYRSLLPGASKGHWLVDLCERSVPTTMDWELELSLEEGQQCQAVLGGSQLGRDSQLSAFVEGGEARPTTSIVLEDRDYQQARSLKLSQHS